MKRLLLAFAGAIAMVGVTAIPVGAAVKGAPTITNVKGTITGTMTTNVACGYTFYDRNNGNGTQYQSYFATEVIVNGALLNASGTGKGTIGWHTLMSPLLPPTMTWTFTGAKPADTLTGQVMFNGGVGGPTTYSFQAWSGTGKFANVMSGMSQLQTMPATLTMPNPVCPAEDPDKNNVEGAPVTQTAPISLTVYGQLLMASKPQIDLVKGTIVGQMTTTATCGYATYDNGQGNNGLGNGPQYQQYQVQTIDVQGAVLNASGTGKGTMAWQMVMSPFPEDQQQPVWTFTGAKPADTLTGQAMFNWGGGGGGQTSYMFQVQVGTGKFLYVNNGLSQLQTYPVMLAQPQPSCADPDNVGHTRTTGPTATLTVPINLMVYGQLIY